MMQCAQCEFFGVGPDGAAQLRCDPYRNIKEPECLVKWQLLKLDTMVQAYRATLQMYERLAPLQERMFRHMERELDEADEGDAWKHSADEGDEDDEGDGDDDEDDDGAAYGGGFTR